MKTTLNYLPLIDFDIYQQLIIEEAILKKNKDNWLITNIPLDPTIVMGISNTLEKMINLPLLANAPLCIVRRFSGGGTVITDQNTIFITFIMNSSDTVSSIPGKVFDWISNIYEEILPASSRLKENDFVISDKKFGGNAQYMKRDRWLHHTSFLWDYSELNMNYLKIPERAPLYRAQRSHTDFICKLKPFYSEKQDLFKQLVKKLNSLFKIEYKEKNSLEILKAIVDLSVKSTYKFTHEEILSCVQVNTLANSLA